MRDITLVEHLIESVSRGSRKHNYFDGIKEAETADSFIDKLKYFGYEEIDDDEFDNIYKNENSNSGSAITIWSERHGKAKGFYSFKSKQLKEIKIIYIVIPDRNRFHVFQVFFFGGKAKDIYSSWYGHSGKWIENNGMVRVGEFNEAVFGQMTESVSHGKSTGIKYIPLDAFDGMIRFLENSDMDHLNQKKFLIKWTTNENMVNHGSPCWTVIDWSGMRTFSSPAKTQLVISDGKDQVGFLWYDHTGELYRRESEWYSGFYGMDKCYNSKLEFSEKAIEKIDALIKTIIKK